MKKKLKPLVLIALVAFLMRWCFSEGVKRTDADWSIKWALRDVSDLTVTLQREVSERAKEQRRQKIADEERKRADEELAKVQADFNAAQLAGDGLQRQLTELRGKLTRSETGSLSAIAAAGAAKAEVASLLAELLGEADDLAGKFATEADERYVSGQSCEQTYDRVTQR
ncbi:TPA: DUF2514 family protein [Citrobacter farmeri]|nr:DUF2514 family protein [Citrobacter farmeri]